MLALGNESVKIRPMKKTFYIIAFGAWVSLLSVPSLPAATKDDSTAIENTLGQFFQIYMLKEERQSKLDRVTVKADSSGGLSAEISYWRSLKARDPVEEICNAYTWLLFGRGTYGKGASEAFKTYPSLREVKLMFFDVEFTTKLGTKRAEILPSQRVIPYLRVSVREDSLARKKPDWAKVLTELEKGKCADVGKKYLDSTWFDEGYLRQAR